MADSDRGAAAPAAAAGADDLSSDDETDEEELAAWQAAMAIQIASAQPVPRQLHPPPQAPLLNKMTEGIQKKDKQEKEMDADEDEEEQQTEQIPFNHQL